MSSPDLNPQSRQMADESMVRNLAAQAHAIWPQEEPLLLRYALPRDASILDAGCGTGEIAWRVAELFPGAHVLGVDILDAHLELARQRYAALAPRLRFEHQSVFDIDAPDGAFGLAMCRHVLHSIPYADKVIGELVRVTKPGGRLHLIPEDYGMLQFERAEPNPSDFWHEVPPRFGQATGTDLFIGRHAYGLLTGLGIEAVTVDYVVVDTLRVPRETFAAILTAWRDGYCDAISEHTALTATQARQYFDRMIANVRASDGYAVWFVPVVSGRVPNEKRR